MNTNRDKNKIIIFLGIAVLILLSILGWIQYKEYQDFKNELYLHKPISFQDVTKVRVSKDVYKHVGSGAVIEHVDLTLDAQELKDMVAWFNAISPDSVREINLIDQAIIAGIVLQLKSGKEIRIQYDSNQVYVTRNDMKRGMYIKYLIEQEDIKRYFEKITKGYYFGQDKVKVD